MMAMELFPQFARPGLEIIFAACWATATALAGILVGFIALCLWCAMWVESADNRAADIVVEIRKKQGEK